LKYVVSLDVTDNDSVGSELVTITVIISEGG